MNSKSQPQSPRPYLLYALLIFAPLARGSVQGWAVTLIHMITLIGVAVFLVRAILDRRLEWVGTSLDIPALVLLTILGLSMALSQNHRLSLWAFLLVLNYVAVFYWVIQSIRTRSRLRELIYVVAGVALFIAVFGYVKTSGGSPFPWWDYTDLGRSGSFTSTYGNRNHLAGYMEMAAPLVLGLCLTGLRGWRLGLAVYVAVVLISALMVSLSRGGWFAAFWGLLFMGVCLLFDRHFRRKGVILAMMAGAAAVAFIALLSTPVVERIMTVANVAGEPDLQMRFVVWGGVLEMMQESPLLGTGPGTFAYAYTQYQPPGLNLRFTMAHNDYLQFAAETGLPVLAVVLWGLVVLYRRGFQKMANSRLIRGTALGALAGITAILIHSVFDFNLHIPANALLFTVLCAIVAAPVPPANDG